ncbi:MAG: ABC transporter permease [Microbacterium sp.]|nr:ABC transporter permease [Microbacterium sp.]
MTQLADVSMSSSDDNERPRARRAAQPRRGSYKATQNRMGYLFILPFLIYFAVFLLAPMIMSFVISFMEWDLRSAPTFVGLDNYANLMFDPIRYPEFWPSLGVTLQYILLSVPVGIIIAVVISAMLNSNVKGESFFKTAYFIPNVTAIVAVAAMWIFMLDPQFGLINEVLGTNISFLGMPQTALATLAVMAIWTALGYNILILLSAMKSIDESLYDAAKIDGANAVQRFTAITLPSIQPIIFFIVITGVIGAFQAFDQMYLMTGGGPDGATLTYLLSLYNHAFRYFEMGTASAMSYLLLLVILFVTWIGFRFIPQKLD